MDTLRWQAGTLFLLDQTKLPFEEIYLPCQTWQDVRQAISVLGRYALFDGPGSYLTGPRCGPADGGQPALGPDPDDGLCPPA